MAYIVYYDFNMEYYRIMEPKYRYRENELPILKTDSSKIAYKTASELNVRLLREIDKVLK